MTDVSWSDANRKSSMSCTGTSLNSRLTILALRSAVSPLERPNGKSLLYWQNSKHQDLHHILPEAVQIAYAVLSLIRF